MSGWTSSWDDHIRGATYGDYWKLPTSEILSLETLCARNIAAKIYFRTMSREDLELFPDYLRDAVYLELSNYREHCICCAQDSWSTFEPKCSMNRSFSNN